MHDPPVTTVAVILHPRGDHSFAATLPNGKPVVAHLPAALATLTPQLTQGTHVTVELTPYDFDHARIAGLASAAE